MGRARDALDDVAQKAFKGHLLIKNTDRIEFNINLLQEHTETLMRVTMVAIQDIGLQKDYAPRMEKVEDLVDDLQNNLSFCKRSLGGVIFEIDHKREKLILMSEIKEV